MLVRSSRHPLAAAQRGVAAVLPPRERSFHAESSRAAQLRARLLVCPPSAGPTSRPLLARAFSASPNTLAMPQEKDSPEEDHFRSGDALPPSGPPPSGGLSPSPSAPGPVEQKSAATPAKRASSKVNNRSKATRGTGRSSSKSAGRRVKANGETMTKAEEKEELARAKTKRLWATINAEQREREAREAEMQKTLRLTPQRVFRDVDNLTFTEHGPQPTLDDLEKFRVTPPSRSPMSEVYLTQYTELWNRLSRAFLRRQLYKLCLRMNIFLEAKSTKTTLLERILNAWGWQKVPIVPPQGILCDHHISLSIEPHLAYLLIRDTAFIHSLIIRRGLDVRFSPNPLKKRQKPLDFKKFSLELHGPWHLVETAKADILTKQRLVRFARWSKQDMLNWDPPDSVLDQVSAEGGAFIERGWQGNDFSAHYFNEQRSENAKDTMIQGSVEPMAIRPYRQYWMTGSNSSEPQYAMLPHMPLGTSPLPWIAGDPSIAHRVRQIGGWHITSGFQERAHQAEDLSITKAWRTSAANASKHEQDRSLASLIEGLEGRIRSYADEKGTEKELRLRFGHINIVPDAKVTDQLTSALPDPVSLQTLRDWSGKNSDKIVFSPGLSPPMQHFSVPGESVRARRVTYVCPQPDGTDRSAPVTKAVFSYTFPGQQGKAITQEKQPEKAWHLQLKEYLADITPVSTPDDLLPPPVQAQMPSQVSHASQPFKFRIELLHEAEADVMLPARSVDVRVVSTARRFLPMSAASEEMSRFFDDLASGKLPSSANSRYPQRQVPLHTEINGKRFILHEDVEVDTIEAAPPSQADTKNPDLVVQMVTSIDKVFPQQERRYSELLFHGKELSPVFWKEFASISRDVRSETVAQRQNQGLWGNST